MAKFTQYAYEARTVAEWAKILGIPADQVPTYLGTHNMSVVLVQSECDTDTHVCTVVKVTPVVGEPPLPPSTPPEENPYNPDGSPKWQTFKIVNGTIISTVHPTKQAYEQALAAGETTNREALVQQIVTGTSSAVGVATAAVELKPVPAAAAAAPAAAVGIGISSIVVIGAALYLLSRKK
jgi:hypothetical protein